MHLNQQTHVICKAQTLRLGCSLYSWLWLLVRGRGVKRGRMLSWIPLKDWSPVRLGSIFGLLGHMDILLMTWSEKELTILKHFWVVGFPLTSFALCGWNPQMRCVCDWVCTCLCWQWRRDRLLSLCSPLHAEQDQRRTLAPKQDRSEFESHSSLSCQYLSDLQWVCFHVKWRQ